MEPATQQQGKKIQHQHRPYLLDVSTTIIVRLQEASHLRPLLEQWSKRVDSASPSKLLEYARELLIAAWDDQMFDRAAPALLSEAMQPYIIQD